MTDRQPHSTAPDEATQAFIAAHRHHDPDRLALQASKHPQVDMPMAVRQIAGWQCLRDKVPSWAATDGLLYPPRLALEQCSSEATARYKRQLVGGAGQTFTDLTGGLGIDCHFMAAAFAQATYVERQPALAALARHNFPLLGSRHIQVVEADSTQYLTDMQPTDCIYLDPARRDKHGGKVVEIDDCEPNVCALEELLLRKGRTVWVKLSPMLDLSRAMEQLRHVAEVHIVAVRGECKELLIKLTHREVVGNNDIPITCVNLKDNETHTFTCTREEERRAVCTYADRIGAFLYEPWAPLLKAGAFRLLSERFQVQKLHPNSHLYTADQQMPHFPGRGFAVEQVYTFSKQPLKALQGTRGNLSVRNFPGTVAALRQRLRITDGGDTYLFATTTADNRHIIIGCQPV